MVNIKLMNNWRIRSDKYNFILVREEASREYNEGYYTTLQACIEGFINKKIRLSNATSIEFLIQYLKSLQSALNKVLQPFNLEVKPINEVKNADK